MTQTKATIEVTKQDLSKGQQSNCCMCPIALAVKRQFDLRHVSVDFKIARYARKNGITGRFTLPKVAQDFIKRFDAGKPVAAFSFQVVMTELPIQKC